MTTKYPHLFSTFRIKNLTYRNRIVATPGMSGWPSYEGAPSVNSLYETVSRAKGGAAVVTMGETTVNRTDAIRANQIFLTQSEHMKGSTINPIHLHGKLVEAVNRHGAIANIQLYHAGEAGSSHLGGSLVLGPTGYTRNDGTVVTEMNEEHMAKVCADFENAARIAKGCGYQQIQVHCGHGWLLAQFLSPLTNKRKDGYGGSLENRAKFPLQVIDAVRRGAGNDTVIEIRISGEEYVEGGMHIEEVADFIAMARDKIDIAHISAGCCYSSPQYTFPSVFQPHGQNVENAAYVKSRVDIPVSVVGGLSDPEQMERIIAEGKADFVCMTRQLFADPETPKKAFFGKEDEIRPCIRCSNCLGLKALGHHACDVNPDVANGTFKVNSIQPVQEKRRVLVVGGGPGGMNAAITAFDRGHEVILCEKTASLGGTIRHAEHVPFKGDLFKYMKYLVRQVEKRGIDVRLNTEVTPDTIDEIAPDNVIVAVGASPVMPKFAGMDKLTYVDALVAHEKAESLGKSAVVIGGGLVGCETAIHMKQAGMDVVLIEMADAIARDANAFYRSALLEQAQILNLDVRTGARCEGFEEGGVLVENADGSKQLLPCDFAVIAVGMRSNRETVEALREKVGFGGFREIGDCYKPETVRQAIHHGYYAAMDIV